MHYGMKAHRWLLPILLVAAILLLPACSTAQETNARIGVYDSRAVALAWAGTKSFDDWMGTLQSEYQKAREAGDQKKAEQWEAEAQARQQLLHMQVFSTAPVDDILARIEDSLPEIKQNNGITIIVSKWDKETLTRYPSAEQIDVTMALVDAFHPGEEQRKIAVEIQQSEPIPLEEARKIKDW